MQAEAESLKTTQQDYRKERTFLEDAVKQADGQFAALGEQQEGEEKGVQADEGRLDRVVKLFGSGSLPSPRVTESRRALLLSSTRRLQTTVELMRLQRQREDSARQIDRSASQRTVALLRELRGLQRPHNRPAYQNEVSRGKSLQPVRGSAAVPAGTGDLKPQVNVIRKSGQSWEKIVASEDFDLEPGDVIEITLRAQGGS